MVPDVNQSRPGGGPTDNVVQPFQVEASSLRGRMVRLGDTLNEILDRHDYPEIVARLLGETVTMAALMASALKYDGVFTLQVKGSGPISYLVADMTSAGDVRAYANVAGDVPGDLRPSDGGAPLGDLLGQGHLAFTVDQGQHTQRYQGIVELRGDTLSDCLRHYFRQSEQVDAGIKLAIGRDGQGRWRAGGLMMQRLPDGQKQVPRSDREDDWRRAMILMDSATDAELLSPELEPNGLLFRLFHEDGVRVYTPQSLRDGCRCSRERVVRVLHALSQDDMGDLKADDGKVHVTCEFCTTDYVFDDSQLAEIMAAGRA